MKYLKIYESYYKRSVSDYIKENNIKNDVTTLYCYSNEIESLKGIENLTNLTYLDCSSNKIESLNGIEKLINLEAIYCWDNILTSLDGVENLINLYKIECYNNPLRYPTFLEGCKIYYDIKQIEYFQTYECQKEFLTKFPERATTLKKFGIGIHDKIRDEFPDLVEGSEFGFFNLR